MRLPPFSSPACTWASCWSRGAVNGISLVSTAPISAFTAATRVENFTQAFGQSGCEAISIFVAQNRGAGHRERTYQGFARGAGLTILVGFFFSALMVLAARPLSMIFLSDPEAVSLCASYLRIIGWFYFLSFTGHSYVGWFRGNGRMNITFWGTTIRSSAGGRHLSAGVHHGAGLGCSVHRRGLGGYRLLPQHHVPAAVEGDLAQGRPGLPGEIITA